jgi:spore germination protein YaaH/putative cell wall-binding protein
MIRRLHLAASLAVIASLLAAPLPAAADEPTLGDAITLPDGSVLPPLPPELSGETITSEMLTEHGGAEAVSTGGVTTQSVEPAAVAADPLVVEAQGASGPGGALPNGLRREVLGFLPYWKLDATTRASLRLDLVSTIAYFSIGAQADGRLVKGTSSGWTGWTSAAMTELMNAAHARGVKVVPTVTLMSWAGDYTALTTLLNSATNRARLVGEIVGMVRDRRADGVNIDFEPVPSSLRTQFTTLVREVKAGLRSAGVGQYLTVSTMAGAAAWATGYDVVGLTASGAADALMVMAYDFHYAGSARAGGVAPIESNHIYASADAMRDHLARVPASKLIWGIPYYGRAWNTTTAGQNSTVRSPVQSVAFSYYWTDAGAPAGGRVLAERFGRKWDSIGQVPWFVFWDAGSNGYRQGYYDDPASLRVKYDAVNANDLAGVGIWHLGMDTGVPDLWNVLEDRFLKRLTRVAGVDRYETAARLSAQTYPAGVPVAYVAAGTNFPDALAAGPAAVRGGGPVLLTGTTRLPPSTASELARLRPGRIVVVGGLVSSGVLEALRPYATSGTVDRIAGADRYATAAGVSAATFAPGAPVAYVASGLNFPDALTGGAAAGRQKGPMLLVGGGGVPTATARELTRLRPATIVVLGSSSVIGDAMITRLRPYATSGTVTRLAGADRYATGVAVSQATAATDGPRTVYVATGASFPDGLAGSPVAARAGGPLLIVPPTGLTPGLAAELRRLNPPRIVILGGTASVPNAVANQIAALWD